MLKLDPEPVQPLLSRIRSSSPLPVTAASHASACRRPHPPPGRRSPTFRRSTRERTASATMSDPSDLGHPEPACTTSRRRHPARPRCHPAAATTQHPQHPIQTPGAESINAINADRLTRLKSAKAALQRPLATTPRAPSMPTGRPRHPAVEAPDTAGARFKSMEMTSAHLSNPLRSKQPPRSASRPPAVC